MAMTCVNIGDTYMNTANVTHFIFHPANKAESIEVPKEPAMPGYEQKRNQDIPAELVIHFVGEKPIKFTGYKAETGIDKLTSLIAN